MNHAKRPSPIPGKVSATAATSREASGANNRVCSVAVVEEVVLREVAPPVPSAEEASARDVVWEAAASKNATLFDGAVSLVAGVKLEHRRLTVQWARGTYRNFALRRVPGATSWLPSLFVSVVQPTVDGRVMVGRMGASTAAPRRWQLPGGTVDPPTAGVSLALDGLRAHAALELREEIGVDVHADHLELSLAIGADKGNIGLLFTSPPAETETVLERYAALCAAEAERGREPEFSQIVPAGLADLPGLDPKVEYLDEVMRLYAAQ